MLLEGRSGDVSSMPWGVRGMLVSWANCSVGVPSCPAPPRRPAVRPDPTRLWYVRVLDSTNFSLESFVASKIRILRGRSGTWQGTVVRDRARPGEAGWGRAKRSEAGRGGNEQGRAIRPGDEVLFRPPERYTPVLQVPRIGYTSPGRHPETHEKCKTLCKPEQGYTASG